MKTLYQTAAVFAALLLIAPGVRAGNEVLSLPEAEALALAQHPSVRLAEEEAEVARLRKREAHRGLWPALSLKAEETHGAAVRDLGTPDFTERSYGVQGSYPLFQGGRLWKVYRQARLNHESLKAKAEKTRQEVIYGVREATWNYVKASRALEVHKKALADLEAEKKMADKLLANDTISPQVQLTITAQYQQAALAVDGSEAELTARLWQWTAALGLTEPPPQRPDLRYPPEGAPDGLTLEDCLATAAARHPDLVIQAKAARAAEYGYQANAGLYWPKLNLNGSYGRSGGAFEGERLELSEDYSFGVQLVQYFGGNTLNATGFDQRTSPKIGQTTRTASKTASGSLGIFDGMKARTDKADTKFAFHQAEVQEDRTKMEVANNVREAYAGWKKALAQKKIAENDLALAKTEADIARIKSSHREVPLSERSVTRNRLAQAEASYADARSGYEIARAALARAVGAPDFFVKEPSK